jgi:hypothetical protein
MIPGWRVNPKGLRVDLVDGHVHVLVVLVVVTGDNVLVIGKPQNLHQVFHHTPKLVPVEASVLRVKGDDHVIRAVVARAGVLRVHGLDELARELEVSGPSHARKIGGQEPCRPRLVASTPNVVGKVAKALVARRCTLVPDNHRRPARRSTARRT